MKAIFSLRRHGYLKTVGVFLIAVALIAGVVGCEGEPVPEYDLTMAVNPTGTGTATDQTGTSPYEEGEIVDIEAVAADCYRFANWHAPAGTFGDANNATTTFTMPASEVTVTANFEPVPPDHYKFYEVDYETAPYIGQEVELVDQFGTFNATVGDALLFGNPVEKTYNDTLAPIADDTRHYTLYQLEYGEGEPMVSSWKVTINNQFQDDVELTVWGPVALAVPTQKEDHEAPECLNHFLIYEVTETEFPEFSVHLKDQFTEEDVVVYGPTGFANPVQKTVDGMVTEIEYPDEHWVFYYIEGEPFEKSGLQIENQFGEQTLDLSSPHLLTLPSQKISWEQPLNHFWVRWVNDLLLSPIDEVVQLEDQFVTITANVTRPRLFANPTKKWHGVDGSELTPIWDPRDHLMLYEIDILDGEEQMWEVVVDNQFGAGQWLQVSGPIMVIVPTAKGSHGLPEDLNHFLVYEVISWELAPDADVFLWDQFTESEPEWKMVKSPYLFAVPAHKTHGSVTTPIDGDEHLLLYWINGEEAGLWEWEPAIFNQFFGPGPIPVYSFGDIGDLLAVPSLKVEWSLVPPP
ncbi:MAG: hypothetical protein JSW22_00590 [Chloroflexota bacterium]|nr:MAG: hypothetical protein JSW22_00590 [Chloroflexota bacterium]